MNDYVLIASIQSTLLQNLLFLDGYKYYIPAYFGATIDETLHLTEGSKTRLFYSSKSIDVFVDKLEEHIKKDSNFGNRLYEEAVAACNEMELLSKRIAAANYKDLSNKEICGLWQEYRQGFILWSPFLVIPNPFEHVVETDLRREIFGDSFKEREWQKLTSLPHSPAIIQEQQDLLELAYMSKCGKGVDLNAHWQEYRWLGCYTPDSRPLVKEVFKDRFDEYLSLSKTDLERAYYRSRQRRVHDAKGFEHSLKNLRLSKQARLKLELLRKLVYLKSYRMEAAMKVFFYGRPFLRETCNRLGISLSQLCRLTPDEVEEALGNLSMMPNNLSQRYIHAVVKSGDKVRVYFGEEAIPLFDLVKKSEIEGSGIVKGNTACIGRAKGKVGIVNARNICDFRSKEVLVAEMTTPDYLPAMARAAAIVTDVGGVTSHAAIVSRELGVPCIVGTGNATKVLKDGDLVEVDAEKGVVRRIEEN